MLELAAEGSVRFGKNLKPNLPTTRSKTACCGCFVKDVIIRIAVVIDSSTVIAVMSSSS